jgi:hypothetical protein
MTAKATLQLADGTFTGHQAGAITPFVKTQNKVVFVEALILPGTVSAGSKIVLETGDKTFELPTAGVYASGELYAINCVFGAPGEPPVIEEAADISITSAGGATSGKVNTTLALTAAISNLANATYKECYWTSSDPAIAEISKTGALTATLRVKAGGTVNIIASTFDGKHSAPFTFTADNTGNRFINPGFEIGNNAASAATRAFTNADVTGWEDAEEWHYVFFKKDEEKIGPAGAGPGGAYTVSGKVTSQMSSWIGANGSYFWSPLPAGFPVYTFREGNAITRVGGGGNATSSFYQTVPVTPGETYRFGGKIGARGSEDVMKAVDANMIILSPDGLTVYDSFPIDFETGDGGDLTMYCTNPTGCSVLITFFIAEEEWTAPPGVTEARFQYAQRSLSGTPIICWDAMFFELVEDDDE